MKNKVKVATLAVLLGAINSNASAESQTLQFDTNVKLIGNSSCSIEVETANESTWSLDWELNSSSAESGTLTKSAGDDNNPLFVKVKVKEGSGNACHLGNMKFGASLPATALHVESGKRGAFKSATSGGFWRYMPVVSKLALFTDVKGLDDSTTGAIELTKVKVKDAAGTEHSQTTAASHVAASEITALADFNANPAMALTDNYFAVNGVAPLSVGAGDADLSFKAELTEGEFIKGALIGVGAVVAMNPEDAEGKVYLDAVGNAEKVRLPFTVNVDNA